MAKKKMNIGCGPSATEDAKWRAEDDLRTISRAQEVLRDKSRLAAARAEAKRQQESLSKVQQQIGRRPAPSRPRNRLEGKKI